tara:strand:+ start:401 stop:2869 length:2469 start_codon:yes stop_codon:yes gene_type:complete
MEIRLDDQLLGEASTLSTLEALLGDRLEEVVWCSLDGNELDLTDLDESKFTGASQLELCTLSGWCHRNAALLRKERDRLQQCIQGLVVVAESVDPVDVLEQQFNLVSQVLADLIEASKSFAADDVAGSVLDHGVLATTFEVVTGGRHLAEQAIISRDFLLLADVLRQEWSLALSFTICLLDPEAEFEELETEAPLIDLGPDETFQANLEALGERFPGVIADITAAWDARDEDRYQVSELANGHRVPLINGFRQWSGLRPRADTDSLALKHRADRPDLIFKDDDPEQAFWDVALSWGVPADLAIAQLMKERKDRPIFLPRHDLAAFACELHCVDIRNIRTLENVIISTTLSATRWGLRSLLILEDRVRRLSSPTMLQVDPVLGVELHEEVFHTHMARSAESYTGFSRSREWTKTGLENVTRLLGEPDCHLLKDRFKGMPGIMVAPGPSLRKNIHLIPEFAKKGVVCGVSHVLRRLTEMGIDPDLTVCVEAYPLEPHFDGVRVEGTSILVSENTAPDTIGRPVKQFWVIHDGTVGKWLRPEEPVTPSIMASSCTQVALWALMQMGCDPIVLVGLDLALEDGKQYAEGCKGWTSGQGLVEVEGYYGGKVQTLPTYNVFRDQYNLIFKEPPFTEIRCINATEGGAKVESVEQMTLAEVVEEIQDFPDRPSPPTGIEALPGELEAPDWAVVSEKVFDALNDLQVAEVSAFEAGRLAKSAADALRAGNIRKMRSKGRSAARIAKAANEILKKDLVFEVGWLGPQHELSMRRERESKYLEEGSEAAMRHNLSHYLQFLAAIHYGAQELRPLYQQLLDSLPVEPSDERNV